MDKVPAHASAAQNCCLASRSPPPPFSAHHLPSSGGSSSTCAAHLLPPPHPPSQTRRGQQQPSAGGAAHTADAKASAGASRRGGDRSASSERCTNGSLPPNTQPPVDVLLDLVPFSAPLPSRSLPGYSSPRSAQPADLIDLSEQPLPATSTACAAAGQAAKSHPQPYSTPYSPPLFGCFGDGTARGAGGRRGCLCPRRSCGCADGAQGAASALGSSVWRGADRRPASIAKAVSPRLAQPRLHPHLPPSGQRQRRNGEAFGNATLLGDALLRRGWLWCLRRDQDSVRDSTASLCPTPKLRHRLPPPYLPHALFHRSLPLPGERIRARMRQQARVGLRLPPTRKPSRPPLAAAH